MDALTARIASQWSHYQYLNAEAEMRDTPTPSSTPCTPAPNRRFVIARTDVQSMPTTVLSALDNIISPSVTNQNSPYQSYSSALNTIPTADSPTHDSPTQSKKRWSLFKNILPFNSTPGNDRPGEVTPPLSSEDMTFVFDPVTLTASTHPLKATRGSYFEPPMPQYRQLMFKFSLEWAEKPSRPTENHHLSIPRLHGVACRLAGGRSTFDVQPKKPPAQSLAAAKYVGRALAEWELVVAECDNFFEKRKDAGVPMVKLVETPVLSVESFRMAGAG